MKLYKYIFFLFIVIISEFAHAQVINVPQHYDFDPTKFHGYDKYEIAKQIDSLTSVTQIDSLYQLFHMLNINREKYAGFEINLGWQFGNIEELNVSLAQLGFEELNDNMFSFGYGFSFRNKRIIQAYLFDFFSTKKSNLDSLSASLFSINLKAIVGYNLISKENKYFYPFVGFTFGGTNFSAYNKNGIDYIFTDLNSLNTSLNSLSMKRTGVGYTVGLEFDSFTNKISEGFGIGVGFRVSYSRPFYDAKWRTGSNVVDFDKNVELGTYSATVIFKFVGNPQHNLIKERYK